jgi:hypothetical protein
MYKPMLRMPRVLQLPRIEMPETRNSEVIDITSFSTMTDLAKAN